MLIGLRKKKCFNRGDGFIEMLSAAHKGLREKGIVPRRVGSL